MLEPAEVTATVDADGSCAFSMARITTTPYKENVAFLRLAVVPVDVLDGPPEGCHAIGYTEELYLVGKLSRSLNKAAAGAHKTETTAPPSAHARAPKRPAAALAPPPAAYAATYAGEAGAGGGVDWRSDAAAALGGGAGCEACLGKHRAHTCGRAVAPRSLAGKGGADAAADVLTMLAQACPC